MSDRLEDVAPINRLANSEHFVHGSEQQREAFVAGLAYATAHADTETPKPERITLYGEAVSGTLGHQIGRAHV